MLDSKIGAVLAVWFFAVACSSGSGSGAGGSGGQAASSGSGGQSGSGGSGGSSATGGTSPGTAKLTFKVSSKRTYCAQADCNGNSSHISIKDSSDKTLRLSPGDCYTPCDTCKMLPCPGAACQQMGVAVNGDQMIWDGRYFEASTCGQEANCLNKKYAAPGKFTARMCATPGTLAKDQFDVAQCTASGPQECVDVSFDFPGTQTYTGQLPD